MHLHVAERWRSDLIEYGITPFIRFPLSWFARGWICLYVQYLFEQLSSALQLEALCDGKIQAAEPDTIADEKV